MGHVLRCVTWELENIYINEKNGKLHTELVMRDRDGNTYFLPIYERGLEELWVAANDLLEQFDALHKLNTKDKKAYLNNLNARSVR